MKKVDRKILEKIFAYAVILAASIVFVLLNSTSTSPLFPYCFGSDSAQFETVGMGWAAGKIPYRDLFDHKGPMAFFFDMLSFKIWGSKYGLVFFQSLLLCFDFIVVFKMTQLHTKKYSIGFISIFLTFIFLAHIYDGGNMGEEYCLPMVLLSTYLQYKFWISKEKEHPHIWAGIYGVAFGICVFSKLTNGVAVCCGAFIILIELLINKKYQNIVKNIIAFIVGFLIIAVPFSLYFAIHGSFKDMIFAMIEYNVSYQLVHESWISASNVDGWSQIFYYCFPFYCVVFTIVETFNHKKWNIFFYSVLVAIMDSYLMFSGSKGSQYVIIMLPNLIVLLAEIYSIDHTEQSYLIEKIFLFGWVIVSCYSITTSVIKYPSQMYVQYQEPVEAGYEILLNGVPEEQRDSLIMFGGDKDFYLKHNIVPCYKYFTIQCWHASFNEKVKEDIYNTFLTGDAMWIIAEASSQPFIQDILDARYFLVAEVNDYSLYHINFN